jgi:hypothetical protein
MRAAPRAGRFFPPLARANVDPLYNRRFATAALQPQCKNFHLAYIAA